MRICITIVAIASICLVWTVAEAGSFSLGGRVLDPRGAPVAGANVKLLNAGGTVICESTRDEQGCFNFRSAYFRPFSVVLSTSLPCLTPRIASM
jgi:hypothetical protein